MKSSVVALMLGAVCLVFSGASSSLHAFGEKATADIKGADGKDLGSVKIVETTAGVLIRAKLKGLPPGPHALHVHETGKCEGDFKSANAIYNPLGAKHGFLNDEGPMVGDLRAQLRRVKGRSGIVGVRPLPNGKEFL